MFYYLTLKSYTMRMIPERAETVRSGGRITDANLRMKMS